MRHLKILFLVILISASSAAFAKDPIITCDKYSGKTLENKASHFYDAINHAARKYNVNSDFIKAVITVETCFRPNVRGTSGERGLMQLLPSTAKKLGVSDHTSSWQNIHAGTRYLKSLLDRFGGNKHYAAAAYNGGPGAVSKETGPRFQQVRRYSSDVMRAYHKMRVTPATKASGSKAVRKIAKKSSRAKQKSHKRHSKARKIAKTKLKARKKTARKSRKSLRRLSTKRVKRKSKRKSRKSKTRSKKGTSKRTKKKSRKRVSKKHKHRAKKKGSKKRKYAVRKKVNKKRKHRAKKKAKKRAKYYRVKKNQSLSRIAKSTGVSVKRLKRLNRLKSSKIRSGQKLRLRK